MNREDAIAKLTQAYALLVAVEDSIPANEKWLLLDLTSLRGSLQRILLERFGVRG